MNTAFTQAKLQAESIAQMVAALGVDYDELGNLREWRDCFVLDEGKTLHQQCPNEAKRLDELEALAGDVASEDEARERIQNDALSVEVRSGWKLIGYDNDFEAEEFKILLCTGGPAVQIRGELGNGEPSDAWIEYQGWGTPWTKADGVIDSDTLLKYCREFYFGE